MQIYFGFDNSHPPSLADLAALLGTRDQQLVGDAIQSCCPAQPGEKETYRIMPGDPDRLRGYIEKHGSRSLNTAQRDFITHSIRNQRFTR